MTDDPREERMRDLEDALELFLEQDSADSGSSTDRTRDLGTRDGVRELLEPMLAAEPSAEPEVPPVRLPQIEGLELRREIGRGGMGVVYEGFDTALRRAVAVKVLGSGLGGVGASALVRFRREAELAAALRHPNIVPVHSAGGREGIFHLVMELVRAPSLGQVLERLRGADPARLSEASLEQATREAGLEVFETVEPPSGSSTRLRPTGYVRAVVDLVAQVAEGLAAAHEAGIVHRDVKPGNVLITVEGRAMLTDFGLARSDDTPGVTQTGDAPGTPQYMAPEQVRGERGKIGPSADVFALGSTLFELLTLRRAFDGRSTPEIMARIDRYEPPDADRLNPAVPRDVVAIVQKALHKDVGSRYADGGELARDLRAFLRGEAIGARPVTRLARAARWVRREPWKAAAVLLPCVAVPIIAVLWWQNWEQSEVADVGARTLRDERIDELLATGFLEVGEGRLTSAHEAFEAILEIDPRSEEGVAGLSAVARKQGDAAAVAELDRHREVVAQSVALRRRLASLLRRIGRPDEAEQAAAGLPASPVGFDAFLAGHGAIEDGHAGEKPAFVDGLRWMQRAVLTSERARPAYNDQWLHAAAHVGDLEAIEAATAAAERLWSDRAATWFWISFAACELGELERAVPLLEKTLSIDPDFERAAGNLARCYQELGRFEQGIRFATAQLERFPRSLSLAIDLARLRLSVDDLEGADEAVTRALALRPRDVDARALWTELLMRRDRVDEALERTAQVLAEDPEQAVALYVRGRAFLAKGQAAEALPLLQKATELQPEEAAVFYSLGTCQSALRDDEAAIVAYRRSLELRPDQAKTHTNLANSLIRRGAREEAKAHLERALELEPTLPQANESLVALLGADATAARRHCEAWTRAAPESPDAWRLLAWALRKELGIDGIPDALDAAKKAVEVSQRRNGPALQILGSLQGESGDLDGALATLREALTVLPPGASTTPIYRSRIEAAIQTIEAAQRSGTGGERR